MLIECGLVFYPIKYTLKSHTTHKYMMKW